MTIIYEALQAVRRRIQHAAAQAGRSGADVVLLAVTKNCGADQLRAAYQAGQTQFAESYLQEALGKMQQLEDLDIEWHFIGPVQSNKTRAIAEHFQWVHGVDRARIADRLAAARPPGYPPLNVCIQVNVSGESTKQGVAPADVLHLARHIAQLPQLALRGLMAIPEPTSSVNRQREQFGLLRRQLLALRDEGFPLDTLSMGMSGDLEAAIAEGATCVRVGTAIFGARPRRPSPPLSNPNNQKDPT